MHVAVRWAAVPGGRVAVRLPSILLQHYEGPGCALPGVRPGAAPAASVSTKREDVHRRQHARWIIGRSTSSVCSGLHANGCYCLDAEQQQLNEHHVMCP